MRGILTVVVACRSGFGRLEGYLGFKFFLMWEGINVCFYD